MKRRGFTLIELLAVIVIIGIILAIAIPTITGIISNTTKNAFEVDAKMVLKAINYKKMEDEDFDITTIDESNIASVLKIADNNYQTVDVTINNNVATIVINGKNKWDGLVAHGTIKSITVDNDEDYGLDVTKPVITIVGSNPITIDLGEEYVDAGATALDDIDGDITDSIIVANNVNTNIHGLYSVIYAVSDSSGNDAVPIARIVNVVASLATVTTNPVTNITSSSVTVSGNISDDGGSTITERGIVYGTSANPTISDNKLVVAGTTGVFSGNLTGFTANTTYHARAYAINDIGTSYGDDVLFTTLMGGIDEYTSLAMHMDGADNGTTFIDETDKIITVYGNTSTKTTIKKFGTASGYLDGTGDYLRVDNDNALNIGDGDFTIDLWAYRTSYPAYCSLISKYSSSSDGFSWLWYNTSMSFGYNGASIIVSSNNYTFNLNQWYHLALVRYSNMLTFYVNGNSIGSGTMSTNINPSSGNLTLGNGVSWSNGWYNNLGYPITGYIDEVRISKGIARWTSNFTPPNAPYSE